LERITYAITVYLNNKWEKPLSRDLRGSLDTTLGGTEDGPLGRRAGTVDEQEKGRTTARLA
jgi:hypothetical protein